MDGTEQIVGELVSDARRIWAWLDIDVADPTLFKLGILVSVVLFLLWVLADVYRGEIQNQNFEIGITSHHNRFGYGERDVVFTKQTFDINSENLPAAVKIMHSFTIKDGEKRIPCQVDVTRRAVRLRMAPTAHRVDHHQIAVSPNIEAEIKNRAEVLQRQAIRRYDANWRRRITRLLGGERTAVEAEVHAYLVRIHFSANPWFLLFLHPDRDVKATGWLTLLTSLFAILTEFLF